MVGVRCRLLRVASGAEEAEVVRWSQRVHVQEAEAAEAEAAEAERPKLLRLSVEEVVAEERQRRRMQWKRWQHGETWALEEEGALFACWWAREGGPSLLWGRLAA